MRFKFVQAMLYFVLLMSCPAVTLGQEETRSIEVRVRAVDFDGAPVPGAQVNLSCGGSMVAALSLDDEGAAVEQVEIPVGAESISAQIGATRSRNGPENAASIIRWNSYLEEINFDFEVVTMIKPDQERVNIEFVGHPTFTIEGRIVGEDGAPLTGSVRPLLSSFSSIIQIGRVSEDDRGKFRIPGLRRGAGLTLWCSSNSLVIIKEIGVARTGNDLDLGDVVIPSYEHAAEVRIGVPLGRHKSGTLSMYTLVPFGGDQLFIFLSNYNGVIAENANAKDGVRIPEGQYAVCPQFFLGKKTEMDLIRDCWEGNRDRIIAAGIPVIEARADHTVELILEDSSKVRDSIKNYGVDQP